MSLEKCAFVLPDGVETAATGKLGKMPIMIELRLGDRTGKMGKMIVAVACYGTIGFRVTEAIAGGRALESTPDLL